MICTEFDILLCDYVDGALTPAERAAVEQHAASCAGCGELMRDVTEAAGFLSRVQEIDAPPELVTRIAYQIPVGRPRDPLERRGLVSQWVGVWRPVLQPRFAMGMAMTILSFAMLERCTGIQVQHIKPADLSPVRIWDSVEDKAIRGKDRAVKYYENLRLVYEVETRLKDLREQQDASAETDRKAGTAGDGLGTPQTAGTSPAKGDQKK